MNTTDVENYPDFPEGIQGPELMERFGCTFVSGDVTEVDFESRPFKVWTDDEELTAKAVILASGAAAPRGRPGLRGARAVRGRAVGVP